MLTRKRTRRGACESAHLQQSVRFRFHIFRPLFARTIETQDRLFSKRRFAALLQSDCLRPNRAPSSLDTCPHVSAANAFMAAKADFFAFASQIHSPRVSVLKLVWLRNCPSFSICHSATLACMLFLASDPPLPRGSTTHESVECSGAQPSASGACLVLWQEFGNWIP